MEQQQWSEWIEWKGTTKGHPATLKDANNIEVRFRNGDIETGRADDWFHCWKDDNTRDDIVAYRVRLTAQQPATTEPDRDIDIGDGVDENAAMLARDSAGMVKAVEPVPSFELQIEAEEAPGLLVLAPMERLGATRWGV